jgi:hypothetical protein
MAPANGDGHADNTVRPVFLVDRKTYNGYSSYIRRILVGLSGTAHASALVCPSCVNIETILCPAVESIEHPALRLPIFFMQNRRILLERLSRFKPTVIHAFYPGYTQAALANWLARQLEIPYVLTLHRSASKWHRYENSIRHAAKIITPSETITQQLRSEWPVLNERIDQIHVGSFVEDECRCFADDAQVPSLVAACELNNAEVFEPLLKAIRHLTLDGVDLMLAIMGYGRKEKLIRRQIRSLDLTGTVTVVPPMQPMRSILAGADMYLHLSDTGLFDARLTEAMAVGLAVAGCLETNSGLLIESKTAAFWDPEDEQSIYACLKQCLGQRAETRQLALNGQAHLKANNSVSGMVDRLMQTYLQAQQTQKQTTPTKEEPAAVG